MNFETIHSEIVYHGRAFDVRIDQVRLPDDNSARLDIVDNPPSVTFLTINDKGYIYYLIKYR